MTDTKFTSASHITQCTYSELVKLANGASRSRLGSPEALLEVAYTAEPGARDQVRLENARVLEYTLLSVAEINQIKRRWLSYYSSRQWRLFNVLERLLAVALLGLLLPLLLLIAALVRLTSPGPALFRQPRLGYLCQVFTIYKFRTMIVDAEATSGPIWAAQDDTRYTSIGRFLRKTRLDELPQLLNIARGEMRLIGFRPIRHFFAYQLSKHISCYELRFFIMPGITGWPQVFHDYSGTMGGQIKKFNYELYYLAHANWKMNLLILRKTVSVVLRAKGQ